MALGEGVLEGAFGSVVVMSGANTKAGVNALGGSNTLNRNALQYLKKGISSLTLSGKAKNGRYGTPGNGVYQFSDWRYQA